MIAAIKFCNVMYWLALTIWNAVVVSAAVAAGGVFGTLPGLGITVERFAQYDRTEHGRLAAGMVMEPLFAFVDLVQGLAGLIVLIVLALQVTVFKMALKRPANAIRAICLAAAAGLFIVRIVTISPEMNRELRAYWAAAEAGQVEQAQAHKAAFDAKHPVASTMFQTTLVLLMIAVASSAVALGPGRGRSGDMQMPRLPTMR